VIRDTSRNPHNPAEASLYQSPSIENNSHPIDFLSNGIKIRNGDGQWDAAPNGPYVYAAFAENPFSSPTTAR